ncbi:MAG: hypothetical protein IJU57_06095 [Clostridia bacterium]|nr:hypothetical protein [Clostridia bacterium]
MEFASVNGYKRPVRLCEETRRFAHESLSHRYGLMTRETPAVILDGIEGFDEMTPVQKYDAAIRKICEDSPVRVCRGELVSGSATLGLAIVHQLPATYGGTPVFPGISHLTADFAGVITEGIDGIRARAEAALIKFRGTDREEFAQSCINCLDSFDIWHQRYLDELLRLGLTDNYNNLCRVPHKPAASFYEAVQSIWFTFAFLRLCGNWPGIGRLDKMLYPFYRKETESGALTPEKAREILAHFFIKGCEWICGGDYGSGDAQHYQNLVISGTDENGTDVTNDVTYLILDIIEELGISDFPTTVRLNRDSDEKLLRRVAEVIRYGGGILAVYGEETVISGMIKAGYPISEARKFANDGCWEVQVPGKTYFIYCPYDFLQLLQKNTLKSYDGSVCFDSFDELYDAYLSDIKALLDRLLDGILRDNMAECRNGEWIWQKNTPCTAISLFERDCIGKGCSYLEGGPVYNVISPHIGGLADTVNSLYAMKKMVFDDKKVTFRELTEILADNWENSEALRQWALNRYEYYGNDNDEADLICRRLLSDFADMCFDMNGKSGYSFFGGVSTFGRQLEWSPHRLACASGRKRGEVLAANASPTPGTDRNGATAMIRSYCKNDLSKLPVGAALDIKLLPSCTRGEEGLEALVSLLRGFVSLGGFFMQPDVADAEILRRAQERPEDYQNLSVRVSGWNARFVTLNREWQDMVIKQNECGCGY